MIYRFVISNSPSFKNNKQPKKKSTNKFLPLKTTIKFLITLIDKNSSSRTMFFSNFHSIQHIFYSYRKNFLQETFKAVPYVIHSFIDIPLTTV